MPLQGMKQRKLTVHLDFRTNTIRILLKYKLIVNTIHNQQVDIDEDLVAKNINVEFVGNVSNQFHEPVLER